MKKSRVTCKRFINMQCYTDTEHLDCAKCEKFEPLDHKSNDTVNHPNHYTQGGIECIDALKAATAGLTGIEAVCTANAIKYLWRWKRKNGVEDINKAIWYLNRLRKEVTGSDES